MENPCAINELLRNKLYDGDAKHTILICICKFHFQEKLRLFLERALCPICMQSSCFNVGWIEFDSIGKLKI